MSEEENLLAELRDKIKEKPGILGFIELHQEEVEKALARIFADLGNGAERMTGLANLRSLFGVGDQKVMHPLDEGVLIDAITEMIQKRNPEQAEISFRGKMPL